MLGPPPPFKLPHKPLTHVRISPFFEINVFKPGPNRPVQPVEPSIGRKNGPVNPFNPVSILNRTQPAQPAVQPRNRRPGAGFDEPKRVTRERKKSERGVDSVPVVMDSVDSVPVVVDSVPTVVDSREGWSDPWSWWIRCR
ncbi:hypothetical protein Acr_07g0010400 [Actinidia rufa]|uniref:Uncharacterized protein n=1 Tax=Actinidia rufa TaxID=165716 RepID=A0A7J0EWR5_9ERIC|nr:hypothetical protein Acr_07g0010400 [Actinidia rufa]